MYKYIKSYFSNNDVKRIECEFKMKRLFNLEKGCINRNDRGSFIIGKCDAINNLMYVSVGWNERDEVFCDKNELKQVITFLTENAYEPYNSEDMIVYVNQTDDENYLKYRQDLPGPVLSKEDAMKFM
jgi:hypothetical protein